MRTCAAGPCLRAREPGRDFCSQHGQWSQQKSVPQERRSVPNGDAALVCPHCQTTGRVSKRSKRVKRGISGGKATGAILTGGLSLLGTGLSRRVQVTEMRCAACGTNWTV